MSPSNEPTGHNEPTWWGPLIDVLAGQRGGGCEIRTREGVHPTRFPTMLAAVHHWPPPFMACADARRVAAGEWSWTGVNEPRNEPTPRRAAWPGGRVAVGRW